MRLFKNQTHLKLTVNTGVDLTDTKLTQIVFRKPDKTLVNLDAAILDPIKGTIFVELDCLEKNILTVAGNWRFWAAVTFNDNTFARGESYSVEISEDFS